MPTVTKLAPGQYLVDSFSSEADAYKVDLHTGVCSCPHWVNRLRHLALSDPNRANCKHIVAARAERWSEVCRKAQELETAHLEELLPDYEQRDLVVATAIRGELFDREQAAGSWA